MNIQFFTTRFSANAEAIERLLKNVDESQARWKPTPEAWSILEVVCHLCDEERLDFRTRLDLTLHQPGEAWPPFDPLAWVTEHNYEGKNIGEQLLLFLAERYKSIEWLNRLENPQWSNAYAHSKLGEITAGSLLGSWLAHDYLHIQQLGRLYNGYLAEMVSPHSLDYAAPNLSNG